MLVGEDLHTSIKAILMGDRPCCAVAFWGTGSETLFDVEHVEDTKIICNLATGSTNPHTLEILRSRGADVRQCDQLHAKVYIGGNNAVICSANASINGLGLEGQEQAYWIEAGAIEDDRDARSWFNALWLKSRPIGQEDLDKAKVLFSARKNFRPTQNLKSFLSSNSKTPLLSWVGNEAAEDNLNVAVEQFGGSRELLARRVDNGIEVAGQEDRSIPAYTWCLQYATTPSRVLPAPRKGVWWTCLAGPNAIVEDVRRYTERQNHHRALESVMMEIESVPPEPFVLDRRFIDLLHEVLRDPVFRDITATEYEGSYFTSARTALMHQAWLRLAELY